MRERITFIHNPEAASFDPKKQLRVEKTALHVEQLTATREERLIFEAEELPQEVFLALRQCQQLHLRWAGEQAYAAVAPFSVRVSPGLHVFFTPSSNGTHAPLLCPLLAKVFGETIACVSPETSFTAIPKLSDRFMPSTAFNYYSPLHSLGDMGMYLLQKVCPSRGPACLARASRLATANSLDIDWDAAARTLTFTAYQDAPTDTHAWDETFTLANSTRLEVGILTREKPVPADTANLAFSGLVTVVGKDKKPDSVMFTFPSRHHDSSATYAMSFVQPTGLHPTMRVSLSPGPAPPGQHCNLCAHLTLPSVLFPDKYQLSAPLFLKSKNLRNIRSVWGETDLEAPDWAVEWWGSSMLLDLLPPIDAENSAWHADIPLHLRYLAPAAGGLGTVEIPWPVLFWACRADGQANFTLNPFDLKVIGYDGFFAPNTLFYHLRPNATNGAPLREILNVPVLDVDRSSHVESITATVIIVGLAWVLWKLLATSTEPRGSPGTFKSKQKKKQ